MDCCYSLGCLAGGASASKKQNYNEANVAQKACLQIAKRLASVYTRDCKRNNGLVTTGDFTVEGRPILEKTYPPHPPKKPRARVMLIGGIHADELSSISIVFKWMRIP